MYQKKYNPQEALERVKLMMKYDLSKTLNENKKVVSEQTDYIGPGAIATGGAFGLGGLALGGGAATAAAAAGASIGSVVPILGTAVGFAAGLGLGALVNWIKNKDYGRDGFKQIMTACSAPGLPKLVAKLENPEIRTIARTIEDAKGDWNDDEEAIVNALQQIPTIADLCAVNNRVPGGLLGFLDSVTDSPKEWKMFTRPLEDMIEDSEIRLTPEEQKKVKTEKKKSDGGGGQKSGGGKAVKIPNELKDTAGVKKFQDWLDGKYPNWAWGYPNGVLKGGKGYGRFGPRTQSAWNKYGSEYSKGVVTPTPSPTQPNQPITPGEEPINDVNSD